MPSGAGVSTWGALYRSTLLSLSVRRAADGHAVVLTKMLWKRTDTNSYIGHRPYSPRTFMVSNQLLVSIRGISRPRFVRYIKAIAPCDHQGLVNGERIS